MRDVRACTSEKSGRGVSGPYLKDMVWKIAAREEQNQISDDQKKLMEK